MSDVKRIIGITVGTPIKPNKLGSAADEVYIATENETEVDIPEGAIVAIFPDEDYIGDGVVHKECITAEELANLSTLLN